MTDNEIVQNYKDLVYRISISYLKNVVDSDDIFQEVFLRYFRKKPIFENEEHEKAWFIRVTINCCKNILTSKWNKNRVPFEDLNIFDDSKTADLFEEITSLPTKYRIVIILYYYEGYKIKEISKILKITESSVKQRLKRAREKLKIELTNEIKGGVFNEKTGYTESI